MATTLAEIIAAVRGRHPAFEKARVPSKTIADAATEVQRTLLDKALHRNRSYLAQQASIVFNVRGENAYGTVGAGTEGGTPAALDGVTFSQSDLPVGSAVELELMVAYSEKPVTSATATTLFYQGAAWTVNEFAIESVVELVAGKGAGQRREISANTSKTLTVSADWETIPDGTSIFRICAAQPELPETMGLVASSPFTASRYGYLVRLNAQGQPYIALDAPLVAKFAVGIPLPPHHYVLGGDVRTADPLDDAEPFSVIAYGQRFNPRHEWAGYPLNGELFLCGDGDDWCDVRSIDLRYVPIPPAFTQLTDYMLLPDTAVHAMTSACAVRAGYRVNGLPDVPKIDTKGLEQEAALAIDSWITTIGVQKRNRVTVMREV